MAFRMSIDKRPEPCDICHVVNGENGSTPRPMLILHSTGRRYDQRNYIWVHLDEFERKLARLKEEK